MREITSDVSYALRRLRSQPLLVLVITASLGLGIGVVTVAFAVANAFLLRGPEHLRAPETFVSIYTHDAGEEPHGPTSFLNYQGLLENTTAIEGAAAVRFGIVTLGEAELSAQPQRLFVEIVTGNYFDILGVRPLLGRTFSAEETQFGASERVMVISHRLWQGRFGGDPGVIGTEQRIDGHLWTVVGIAPPKLVSRFLPLVIDAWIPVGVPGGVYHATPARLASRTQHDFMVFGRLAEGKTLEQLNSQLAVLGDSYHDTYGSDFEDELGEARSFLALSEKKSRLSPAGRSQMTGVAALLLGGTGLVLFIACANIASLLLGQVGRRQREMAVRVALGASRTRLITLSLVESLVLATLGGGFGLFLASLATRSIGHVPLPLGMPSLNFDVSVDPKVVLFGLALSVATCLAFGLVPALQSSRPNLVPALKGDGSSGGKHRRFGARGLLVVGQTAASLVFVVAAGLLLRSLQERAQTDLGFEPEGVALMSKQLPEDEYSHEAAASYFARVRERLASLPSVESAQLSTGIEHSLLTPVSNVEVEVAGYNRGESESLTFDHNSVTPGYLEMLGVRPLIGRTLRESDVAGAPGVAIVNQSFVDRFWPGGNESGLGRRFQVRNVELGNSEGVRAARTVEVIGVVANGQYGMDEGSNEASPFLWTSFYQGYSPFVLIHVKGKAGSDPMISLLGSEIESVPGEVALIAPTSFEELIGFQETLLKGSSQVLGLAGIFGLALAAIGIYGIVSFVVAQRRRELAIRQALGALPRQVFQTAVADGVILSMTGLGLGLLVVLPLAKLLESQLYGISPLDPVAVGSGSAILLLVALLASAVPALRAAGGFATDALKDE